MGGTAGFDRLSIRRYRGLAELTVDGLTNFNLLVGANDVGKTSVLEAIFLLTNLVDPRLSVRVQNWRNYMVQDIDEFSSLFFGLDSTNPIELESRLSESGEVRKLDISSPSVESFAGEKSQPIGSRPRDSWLDSRPQDKISAGQSSSIVHGSRVLRYEVTIHDDIHRSSCSVSLVDHGDQWGVSHKFDSLNKTAADKVVSATYMAPSSSYQTDDIGRLIINKKDDVLLQYLRIINSRVTKIAVQGNIAFLDIGLAEMMPLNMFGSGMKRAAMILPACMVNDERILLIDEIEYGLHYQAIGPLLETLLTLATERQVQIFVTTHSWEVLKSLQRVLSQDRCSSYRQTTTCFALQRDSVGTVRHYRYSYDQFDHSIAHQIELR
jgi:AAA15 family ATPase/GTPase